MTEVQQTPFIKQLAANDRPTRDKALLSLQTFLSGRRDLPHIELLKLWKGLFFCMWMSDRPRPQAALAQSLADLVAILPPSNVLPFLRAFWETISREWTNIDVLRMEKFLLLTRRYLSATFAAIKRDSWCSSSISSHLEVLSEVPVNVDNMRLPNGMRYHVLDIYVDELERVGVLEIEGEEGERLLGELLEPLRRLAKESPTKTVRAKAKEALEDERLPENEKVEMEGVLRGTDEWEGFED